MLETTTQEIAWMVACLVSIVLGLTWGFFAYRDGFADGARWMARGDRQLSRPRASWYRWDELRGVRHGLKEGWYEAARSYSRGYPRGEVETTGMRDAFAQQEKEFLG